MLFGLFGKKKEKPRGVLVGSIIHYFPHVKAAVIKVDKEGLSVGDHIRVQGHTTDFEEKIKSMQIEHEDVQSVKAGGEIAVKMKGKTRRGDQVFLIRD